jgi:hypothetical protein
MNCFYEALADTYMRVRSRFVPAIQDDLGEAEESLEACRANMAAKERDAAAHCAACTRAAVERRRAGDLGGARFHLQVRRALILAAACALLMSPTSAQERKRGVARLDKLRNGLALLDKQLDALRSSELDKELMNSLRASSEAMKKAGIGMGAEEAERVMNELEDQIEDASELTTVLATPLISGADEAELEADLLGLADVDAELGLVQEEDQAILASAAAQPPIPAAPAAPEAPATRAPPLPSAMEY